MAQEYNSLIQLLAKNSFRFFLEYAFKKINPNVTFSDNWHIGVMANELEAVTKNDIKRLIINVPPRSLKSFCVNVAWPAWLLGIDPSRRIISASYSRHLSIKHSLDCRYLIESDWYKEVFPNVGMCKDQNEKVKFTTTQRGYRFATSITGSTTGEGGNYLIVDDPHNASHIHSEIKRKYVQSWFQQSFSSRLDDKKLGAIILVMQRLHQDDLAGFLLKQKSNQWKTLKIPAVAEQDLHYRDGDISYEFKQGEFLHQDREGDEEIERAKNELGGFAYAAQYLQNPIVASGNMVHRHWLRYYRDLPPTIGIVLSWDTAIKAGSDNSYSVCTCWTKGESGYYLLEVIRERLEYPELKRRIIALAKKYVPTVILIEDKASGQSLLQDLKRENHKMPLIGVKAQKDKVTRFATVTPTFEAGMVYLPENAPWVEEYVNEITGFPLSEHSDQVDSTSQYFNYMESRVKSGLTLRILGIT